MSSEKISNGHSTHVCSAYIDRHRVSPVARIFENSLYSRMPETETADLSQSHFGLNSSQFQAGCLFCINSGTETKDI